MASRLSGDGAAGRWVLGCPNAMCDGGRRERAVRGAVGCRAGMARGCLAGEGGEEEDGEGGGRKTAASCWHRAAPPARGHRSRPCAGDILTDNP